MAITLYGTGDSLAVKAWARDLATEVKKGLEIAPLIGTGPNSIIQEKKELKSKGDQVTIGLRTKLVGTGVTEAQVLEGNEESLTTYSDALKIGELAHAVRVAGEDSMDQQRVLFDLRDEAKAGLADWFSERLSLSFFIQVCGYTAASITYRGTSTTLSTVHKGLNTVTAPSTGRKIFATGSADETQASTNTMTLQLVDYAKEAALLANPKIRPVKVNGEDMYVLYMHPTQVTDLRTSTSTGQWLDIQKAALSGGGGTDNPIFSGALGVYNGVVLRQNEDVTTGVNSSTAAEITTVRRAVLLGAQSAGFAQSTQYSKSSPYKWVEKKFDYDRELGVSVQALLGMKKMIFNSKDHGCLTISTYATTH
jgi:N4-gp56 family major capsid protein